jgi:hypothetical protein
MKTALPPFLRRDQWVRDLKIDPINKLVVCIIATHVDCEFVCRTNTKKLVEECRISRQRYSEAISFLSKAGLIFVNKNRRGGRWECNSSIVLCVGQPPSRVAHDDTYHVALDDIMDEEKKEEEKIQIDYKKQKAVPALEDSAGTIPSGFKIPEPEKTGPDQTQTGTSSLEDSHPYCATPLPQVFAPQPCSESDSWPSIPAAPAGESVSVAPVQSAPKLGSSATPVDKGAAILQAYRCEKPSTHQIIQYWCEQERHWFPKAAARRLKKKQGKGPLYAREFLPLMNFFERTYQNAEPAFELVHKVFSNWAAIRERGGGIVSTTYPTPAFIYDNQQLLWSHFDEGLYAPPDAPKGWKPFNILEPQSGGMKFITPDGHIDHAALAESLAAKFAA